MKFDPSLYLVTDRMLSKGRPLEWIVEEAVRGGVTMVQLREKNGTSKEFYEWAILLKKCLAPHHIPLIINDRMDIAIAADAEGLHLGQADLPFEIARRKMGKDFIIGLSVENMEQARQAQELDVDYLGISPVFPTGTKTDVGQAFGLEGLKEMASFSRHPLVAIGGMHAENVRSVLQAGANGIAVVSAIISADDPKQSAQELRKNIDEAR